MKCCLVCLFFFALTSLNEAYKILVIFPIPSRSHGNLGDGIVRHLLKDGHETTYTFTEGREYVTYISPFPYKPATSNVRYIDVSDNFKGLPKNKLKFDNIIRKEIDVGDHRLFTEMFVDMMSMTITNENVQKLLNDTNEHFDAIIAEWMFSELLAGIATVYDCPLIWMSSMDIHWIMLRLIDQPSNPAYTVDIMSGYLPPFNFWQRITELYIQIKVQYLAYSHFSKIESRVYESLFGPIVMKRGRQLPSYFDIQFNASLVLSNSHVSLGQAVAMPPNCISIAGYHIEDDVSSLPEDLKEIMNNAKNGVIYFSMGSNLKSKDMPKQIKDDLLKMFGKLKQTVLWKFEEDLPNTPKNVHILNWAPQQGILSHPNTVLFITHGGLLSTTEAIHYGVPIIGIPGFGDQFINVVRAVKRGFAQRVELSSSMADELRAAIEEITTNPRYAHKAKELSLIYHDRPVPPGKEISHWVKHVIKTRGAPHLRSPALNMPLYQKLYLDLLVVIVVIIFIIVKFLKSGIIWSIFFLEIRLSKKIY